MELSEPRKSAPGKQCRGAPVEDPLLRNQLGLDHERLAYRHHGREETLTDPAVTGARVIEDLLANKALG